MEFFNNIIEKIYSFDSKDIKKYIIVTNVGIVLLITLIQFFFIWKLNNYGKIINDLNDKRKMLNLLAQRKQVIDEEKKIIQDIIANDPYFKIREFCLQIFEQNEFSSVTSKTINTFSEEIKSNGYTEVSINGTVSGISIQNAMLFLYMLEKNKRIYIKDIKIVQLPDHILDLHFSIATLKISISTSSS